MKYGAGVGLVVAMLVVGACGQDDEVAPTKLPETAICPSFADGGNRYASVTLAPGLDGAVFASRSPGGIVATVGQPCATATDHDACMAKVNAAANNGVRGSWSFTGAANALIVDFGVVTAGDDVRNLASLDDLRKAIAPVSTPDEAIAIARFSNRMADCTPNNAETLSDGVELRFVDRTCGSIEKRFEVKTDGSIIDVTTKTLASSSDCLE